MTEYNSPVTPRFWGPLILTYCFNLSAVIVIIIALATNSFLSFLPALLFLLLAYMSNKNRRLKERFYQLIVTEHIYSLENLAALTNTDYKNTLIIIEGMIKNKELRSAILDKDTRSVILSYLSASDYAHSAKNTSQIIQRAINFPEYQPRTKVRLYSILLYFTLLFSLFAFFATFVYITMSMWDAAAFFVILGLATYWLWKRNRYISRFKEYYNLLLYSRIYALDDLAKLMNLPYATVVQDINKLFSYGYLPGYHIDEGARQVYAPPETKIDNALTVDDIEQLLNAETIQICCPQCGAPAEVIAGRKYTCEYCGSKL